MDPLVAVIVEKSIERIIVVLIGGCSIYFGWRLFLVAPSQPSEGEITAGLSHFKLTLKRIGPGVMFAAFGAAIVTTSLVRGVAFDQDIPATQNASTSMSTCTTCASSVPQVHVHYNGLGDGASEKQELSAVVALNQALRLADGSVSGNVLSAQVSDLKRSRQYLADLRDRIVVEAKGTDLIALWKANQDKFLHNPQAFGADDRARLNEIAPWYSTEPVSEN